MNNILSSYGSSIFFFVVVTILMIFWLQRFKERLGIKAAAAIPLSFLSMFVGVLCLVLFAFLESGGKMKTLSFSLFGFTFFMPIAFWLGAKIKKWRMSEVFDIFSLPMIGALVCARINCMVGNCCIGLQIPGTDFRWPTREIELIYYLFFVLYFAPKVLKGETKGEVYPWYMLTYGVVRFVTETMRVSGSTNLFHLSHVWAILCFCIGLTLVIELKERQIKNQKKRR